jgi:hypothetical protein
LSYWKSVGWGIVVCFVVGMAWQIAIVVRALWGSGESGATGFGLVLGGISEFLVSILLAGWVFGSLWYLIRAKRRSPKPFQR